MIKLVIADDHQSLIDGIKLSFEYEEDIAIIGEANDGDELVEIVRRKQPDVIITDLRMPMCDGICATKIIKEEYPKIYIIAFSMFDQPEAIRQMQVAGASGYVMKNSPLSKLLQGVRTVAMGDTFFDSEICIKDEDNHQNLLSPREKQILELVGQGKTSQEIANQLFISKSTVDTHRKNILKKLNVHGKSDLMRFAIERKYDFDL